MERAFRANTPAVASEIISGEAVIMNLRSGMYFSTRGTGSLVWGWLEKGISDAVIVDALVRGSGAPRETVSAAVARFIAELERHELITPRAAPTAPDRVTTAGLEPGTPFEAPVLDVYNDMQDLLLLDPIHDVDQEAGWPSPRAHGDTAA